MTIGDRLKTKSNELGIKQSELANRLKISRSTLNGYFTNYREPDLKTLEKLAIELDTSIEYLVTGKDPTSPHPLPTEINTEEALLIAFREILDREPTDEDLKKFYEIAKIFFRTKE